MKKEYIFLVIGIILATIVFLSFVLFSSPKETSPPIPAASTFTPSRYPIASIKSEYIPPRMEELPYIPQSQGGGIDIKSSAVTQSTAEINKLLSSLPYQKNLITADSQTVDVAIPGKNIQINAWTLTVQVFGIDYQVPENDPDYTKNKQAFLAAVNDTFDWMASKGANPGRIIISWGDRAYIQKRAEEWLSRP